MRPVRLERNAKRLSGPEELLLTDHLVDRLGTHALGQGLELTLDCRLG